MTRKVLTRNLIPKILLAILLMIMLFTVFIEANDFGLTVDEPAQNSYGHAVLSWYLTLGKDDSFLGFSPNQYMPEHGPFFEVIVAGAQELFGHEWYTRAVVSGLAGIVGVVAIALCGYELGGYWLAFIAALFLWLYPRYFGSIFNNSKDIPFAAVMTLILWAVLLLVKQWDDKRRLVRNSMLVGLFIGMAASIRVVGVIWYLVLLFIPFYWWITHLNKTLTKKLVISALKKQAISALLIGIVSFITMLVLWPFILLNPGNLYESIVVMQKYPWDGIVLFNGVYYHPVKLPWFYVPTWLVIGSPLIIVIFTLLGLFMAPGRWIHARAVDKQVAVVCLALLIPLVALIVTHPILYDGPRQFFFLVPVMILLAAYGLFSLCSLLLLRRQLLARILLALVVMTTCFIYLFLIKDMSDLHPYEYTYFNALVGGVPGATGKYDSDYWRICSMNSAQWLANNYRQFTRKQNPTVTSFPVPLQVLLYLPTYFSKDDSHPDFYIGSMKDGFDKRFPNYRIIHTESIGGQVPDCVVKMST